MRLGTFIYNNYRQAVNKILSDGDNLATLSFELGTTSTDYEAYLIAEREYLLGLKTEPLDTLKTVDYMESLAQLQVARSVMTVS